MRRLRPSAAQKARDDAKDLADLKAAKNIMPDVEVLLKDNVEAQLSSCEALEKIRKDSCAAYEEKTSCLNKYLQLSELLSNLSRLQKQSDEKIANEVLNEDFVDTTRWLYYLIFKIVCEDVNANSIPVTNDDGSFAYFIRALSNIFSAGYCHILNVNKLLLDEYIYFSFFERLDGRYKNENGIEDSCLAFLNGSSIDKEDKLDQCLTDVAKTLIAQKVQYIDRMTGKVCCLGDFESGTDKILQATTIVKSILVSRIKNFGSREPQLNLPLPELNKHHVVKPEIPLVDYVKLKNHFRTNTPVRSAPQPSAQAESKDVPEEIENPSRSYSSALGILAGGILGAVLSVYLAPLVGITAISFGIAILAGALMGWVGCKIAQCISGDSSQSPGRRSYDEPTLDSQGAYSLFYHSNNEAVQIPPPQLKPPFVG